MSDERPKLRGKRKFIVAMTSLGMTFVLAIPPLGVVEGGSWVAVVGLVVGLYGVTNVGEHYVRVNGS